MCMAPQTPVPAIRVVFAAFTIASAGRVVMSPNNSLMDPIGIVEHLFLRHSTENENLIDAILLNSKSGMDVKR